MQTVKCSGLNLCGCFVSNSSIYSHILSKVCNKNNKKVINYTVNKPYLYKKYMHTIVQKFGVSWIFIFFERNVCNIYSVRTHRKKRQFWQLDGKMKLFGKLDNLFSVTRVQVFESLRKVLNCLLSLKFNSSESWENRCRWLFVSLSLSLAIQPKAFCIAFSQNQEAVEYYLTAAGNYLNLNCL